MQVRLLLKGKHRTYNNGDDYEHRLHMADRKSAGLHVDLTDANPAKNPC